MSTFKYISVDLLFLKPVLLALAVLLTLMACNDNPSSSYGDLSSAVVSESETHTITSSNVNVVEITARHVGADYIFELSEDEIPSGWTTFRLINDSHSTHFAYMAAVPQGAFDGAADDETELLDYWIQHVTNPFQFFMDTLIPGKELNFKNRSMMGFSR